MDEKTRFGFLVYLLEELGRKRYYGLIVVQKIVYFLREAFEVNLPYDFYFYHFGPYSDELDWDLRMMKIFGFIRIGSDPKRTGYNIEVDKENSEECMQPAQGFISANRSKIKQVLELFGDYTPSGLELASTIHFVDSNVRRSKAKVPLRRIVVERVRELKPKFTQKTIQKQYDFLKEEGIIK